MTKEGLKSHINYGNQSPWQHVVGVSRQNLCQFQYQCSTLLETNAQQQEKKGQLRHSTCSDV